ncbi:MAG: exopolyphosphatase [Flammeovirgaceae bacterium]|nr:exopolyphosphatase [Flammeovirgaceae bacterium]
MDKLAIIDLGTNTFHLLIAIRNENEYEIRHRIRLAVRIGKGGINSGIITYEAQERAKHALSQFKERIKIEKIKKIFAMGTSAIRNASNKGEFLKIIKDQFGWDVKILSGEEEAKYIYHGVASALSLGEGKSLIMDIGGGSVEFIIGNREKIDWLKSFEIGAQRLIDKFNFHDPILPKEIELLDIYLSEQLGELFTELSQYSPTTLVGSSGTFDTLSDIYCEKNDIAKTADNPETPLTLEAFAEIHQELISKNKKDRLKIPGMIPMRVDMIVVASCLINLIVKRYSFSRVRVSSFSLKEGVLAHLAQEFKDH